ncbi:hypothetical protein ISCGN_016792 [Ixodes scapularis]
MLSAASTEASDVQGLLAGLVGDKTVVCTKLKTRYPTYSSFHVSLDKDLFELLNKPEVWPVGCVFRPFYGFLTSCGRRSAAQDAAKIAVYRMQGPSAKVGNVVLAGGTAVAADDGAADPHCSRNASRAPLEGASYFPEKAIASISTPG